MNVNAEDLWSLWRPTFGFVRSKMADGTSAETIEDVVGETMLRVLQVDLALDGRPDGLKRFVFRVAGNLVIDLYRRGARRRLVPLDVVDGAVGRLDAGSDRHDALIDVRAALATLPEGRRRIALAYAEGYALADVAAMTGVTSDAAKHVAKRLRRRLRRIVGDCETATSAPYTTNLTREIEPATRRKNTLRGENVSAINARLTHCRNGHPLDEANTYVVRGYRECRTCRRHAVRRYAARRRAAREQVTS